MKIVATQPAGDADMQDLKPGDVFLYMVAVREKGILTRYYGCEVAGSVSGGRPLNVSGDPINGVILKKRL